MRNRNRHFPTDSLIAIWLLTRAPASSVLRFTTASARDMKASSTLVFVWAEVSAKGMPNFSASFLPSSVDTAFPLFHHLTTYSLGLQIALVTNQDLVYARICMLFHKRDGFKLYLRNLFHPWRNALKRVSISHIINKENTFRTSYVRSSNGSETLLTSSIPNL